MPPRRPTAPHAGAAKARAAARPAAARPAPPRVESGRPSASARPAATGRSASRQQSAAGTGPSGKGQSGKSPGHVRRPVITPVTMVSGVLVVMVLLIAPYLRPWVSQRSQISEGDQKVRQLQSEVDALAEERRRWDDPAYVRAQARERLHFVMPGETGYVVLDDSPSTTSKADPRTASALPEQSGDQPWYARVWESVQIAGDPTTEQARSAAAR